MSTIEIYPIEADVPYLALRSTTPYDLLDYIDQISPREEKYIKDAHKFYFNIDQPNINQSLSDLLSLVSQEKIPHHEKFYLFMQQYPSLFNQLAKDAYERVQSGWKPIANKELKDIVGRELSLTNPRNNQELLTEVNKFMLSLDPNLILTEYIPDNLQQVLNDIKELVNEQRSYLDYESECQKFFILVRYLGIPYGGIFVFYNNNTPELIVIQAITKYAIPTVASLIYPQYNKLFPKLNTILDPVINNIGKQSGAGYIYVNPIGKQGEILQQYYGYKIASGYTMPQPCPNLAENIGSQKVYYKRTV